MAVYAVNGTKPRTVYKIGDTTSTTDYCGNVIYENGIAKTLLVEGGYVSLSDRKYHFYLHDHQGNNRVVADKNGNIEEVNHYYPFGGTFASSSSSVQAYKYNGKELDRKGGLDWYDYGARYYDAALGRWHVVDPMAEKYYTLSPYGYCNNNPICNRDEEGKFINNIIGAVIGGAVDLGVQVTANLVSGNRVFENIDWISVGASTLEGGLTSGLSAGKTLAVKTGVAVTRNVINGIKDNSNVSEVIKEDVTQLWGDTKQYGESIDVAEVLTSDLKDAELTFVGHSLGGGLAAANALKTDKNAITFNPAAITPVTKQVLGLPSVSQKGSILNVVVKGEIVDYMQSSMGLKPDGKRYGLNASYLPFKSEVNTLLRIRNHSIDTVIQKLK